MLTPAISVLSALEGISVGNTSFAPFVVPLTLVVLVGLFAMQSRGTEKIGKLFGPVMVLWFVVLAVLGATAILKSPQILRAVNPMYGVMLFVREPWTAFVALGSVVLAVTGCEALYADMGHFGARAIRWAWLYFALPALLLNYFGQGALLLSRPAPTPAFCSMPWCRAGRIIPMVALATVATIIASQAVISGVFSITRQAVQLGQLPRMEIRHTSATEQGQIYRAAHQCHAVHRRGADRADLQILRRAGHGLWHRGDRRDGDFHRPGRHGGDLSLEMAAAGGLCRVRRAGADRSDLPGLQQPEDRAKAAGCRWRWRRWCSC